MGFSNIIMVKAGTTYSEYASLSGSIGGMTSDHVLLNDSAPGCDREITWSTNGQSYTIAAQTDAQGGTGAKIQAGTVFFFGVPES